MSDGTMAYIGRKPCGCVVAFTVDSAGHRRQVARETAQWIRDGLTIERHAVEAVRAMKFGCSHKATPKQAAGQEAML